MNASKGKLHPTESELDVVSQRLRVWSEDLKISSGTEGADLLRNVFLSLCPSLCFFYNKTLNHCFWAKSPLNFLKVSFSVTKKNGLVLQLVFTKEENKTSLKPERSFPLRGACNPATLPLTEREKQSPN